MNKKEQMRTRRHLRIRTRISGTQSRPRLVIFRSLGHNYAQLIDDESQKVIVSSNDMKAKKSGTKTEMAKKIGLEIAKLAQEKGISSCVFDRNGYKYHGRVKAIAEGAREGGLKI